MGNCITLGSKNRKNKRGVPEQKELEGGEWLTADPHLKIGPGTKLREHYQISQQPLGRGRTSVVWLGLNRFTGERVAIKRCTKLNLQKQKVTEIKILLQLQSSSYVCPFLPRLLATYEDPKRLYLVTNLCSGGDLYTHIASRAGHFSEADAADIVCQLLQALCHVHSHGIVHRDVKPENILFLTHAESGMCESGSHGTPLIHSSSSSSTASTSSTSSSTSSFSSSSCASSTSTSYFASSSSSVSSHDWNRGRLEGVAEISSDDSDVSIGRHLLQLVDLGSAAYEGRRCSSFSHPSSSSPIPVHGFFVSPEAQLHTHGSGTNAPVAASSDVWSVGALLYVILGGCAPPTTRGHSVTATPDWLRLSMGQVDKLPDYTSPQLPDFLHGLLNPTARKRMTAQDALSHPWLSHRHTLCRKTLFESVQNISEFVSERTRMQQESMLLYVQDRSQKVSSIQRTTDISTEQMEAWVKAPPRKQSKARRKSEQAQVSKNLMQAERPKEKAKVYVEVLPSKGAGTKCHESKVYKEFGLKDSFVEKGKKTKQVDKKMKLIKKKCKEH